MSDLATFQASPVHWRIRLRRHPLIRIALALVFIAIPVALIATPFNLYVTDRSLKRLGAVLLVVVILLAYRAYVRVIEKRTTTELSRLRALRELGAGLLLGALLLSSIIGVLAALGAYQVIGSNGWEGMLVLVPSFMLSPVLEEVVFRGIVFRILEQWLGSWIALTISAAIFGVLHLINPGATLLGACDVMLEGGVMLAAAYMLTRRLWLCIGTHFAWNFTQGPIFSAAVSGGTTHGLLQSRLAGPVWLTGGNFGPEASAVAVGICAIAALLLLIAARRKGHVIPSPRGPSRMIPPAS
jgi:membrane protease YdiL (CAAX protease family)